MSKSTKSIKDMILGADDLKREVVEVPEWGVTVVVSEMNGRDREAWSHETFITKQDGDEIKSEVVREDFAARLLVRCLCDEDGNKLFSPDELAALSAKNGKVLNRLFAVADRLNGITPKAAQEIEKN